MVQNRRLREEERGEKHTAMEEGQEGKEAKMEAQEGDQALRKEERWMKSGTHRRERDRSKV